MKVDMYFEMKGELIEFCTELLPNTEYWRNYKIENIMTRKVYKIDKKWHINTFIDVLRFYLSEKKLYWKNYENPKERIIITRTGSFELKIDKYNFDTISQIALEFEDINLKNYIED